MGRPAEPRPPKPVKGMYTRTHVQPALWYLGGAWQPLAVGRGGGRALSALPGLPQPPGLPPRPDAPEEEEGRGGPGPVHGGRPAAPTSGLGGGSALQAGTPRRAHGGGSAAGAQDPRAGSRPQGAPGCHQCMCTRLSPEQLSPEQRREGWTGRCASAPPKARAAAR